MAKIDGAQFSHDGQVYAYLVVGSVDRPIAELTPAERAVAKLVAGGCSNRQIAERRGSSVNTVGNQLASIYTKVGVSSRHELVAWLSRAAHGRP